MPYDFSIVQLEAKTLAGISVRTHMKDAARDCPALWQQFGPKLCPESVGCAPDTGVSYGISADMGADGQFTYWAAVELPPNAPLPEGMAHILLPQGPYVRCQAADLDDLGPAFTAMYMEWPATQSEYAPDMNGLCFELYPDNWHPGLPLEIYGSLIRTGR